MDKDVAGGVGIAGHEAGVDLANGFAFLGDRGHVSEVGNMSRCADGENLLVCRQAHGGIKSPEVSVELSVLGPEKYQLPGLISGDRKGGPHLA